MDSPPMRLMINPDVTPTTYHSPLPVPVPWKDAIKDNLDKDVRLDVLEPVPIRDSYLIGELKRQTVSQLQSRSVSLKGCWLTNLF